MVVARWWWRRVPGRGLSSVGSCAVGAGVVGFVGWLVLVVVVVVVSSPSLLVSLLVSACAPAGGAQEPTRTFLSVTCPLGTAGRCD